MKEPFIVLLLVLGGCHVGVSLATRRKISDGSQIAIKRQTLQDNELLYTAGYNKQERGQQEKRRAYIRNGIDCSQDSSSSNSDTITSTNTRTLKSECERKNESGTEQLLNTKQAEALRLIQNCSNNVFITGLAGTGKSMVLQRAIHYLKETYHSDEWVAVAPTGPTAISVEGQTIHSFAGVGVPRERKDFEKSIRKKEQWKTLKVMVLEEVSMISGEFFDLLSEVVSEIRNDPRPFGGIQLILCGDFLQLPPIPPRNADVKQMTTALFEQGKGTEDLFLNRGFCFQAHKWAEANFEVVQLDQVFRQKNAAFVQVLQNVRTGQVTGKDIKFLASCDRPLPPNEFGISPTTLHSRNKDVTYENMRELEKLPGDTYTYDSMDSVEIERGAPPWAEEQLKNNQFFFNCIAEEELNLKVGAQVMLVKNDLRTSNNKRLVNGSRGTVIGFRASDEEGNIDLVLQNSDEFSLPNIILYPVIQFVNGVKKLIRAQKFQSRLVGLGSVTRIAIPLKLAWAITTHKAQGLTLDYVIADVGGVFAEAQVYVALSRVSDQNGLELRNFSPRKVRSNIRALAFYSNPNGSVPYWDSSDHTTQLSYATASKVATVIRNEPKPLKQTQAPTPKTKSASTAHPQYLPLRKTFVFSGVLDSLTRGEAEVLVQKYGGVLRGTVSGKTNFLVIGEKFKNGKAAIMGSNYRKAMQIVNSDKNRSNLQILNEEELRRLLQNKD